LGRDATDSDQLEGEDDMNTIHPAVIWEIERRRREHEVDNRLPLYVPMPEHEPEKPEKREVEYVIEF
jgi:hypothetical protein